METSLYSYVSIWKYGIIDMINFMKFNEYI